MLPSSFGALGGHRSPISLHPPHVFLLLQDYCCLHGVGRTLGDDRCALERSQSPLPGETTTSSPAREKLLCPLSLWESLMSHHLSVVHICQTSNAPVTSRASGTWGPQLGPPLTPLPRSTTCLGALADAGPLPSTVPFRPLSNPVLTQPPCQPYRRRKRG